MVREEIISEAKNAVLESWEARKTNSREKIRGWDERTITGDGKAIITHLLLNGDVYKGQAIIFHSRNEIIGYAGDGTEVFRHREPCEAFN